MVNGAVVAPHPSPYEEMAPTRFGFPAAPSMPSPGALSGPNLPGPPCLSGWNVEVVVARLIQHSSRERPITLSEERGGLDVLG